MTQPSKYRIILVGCGKMGGALLTGWKSANLLQRADILDPNPIHDSLMDTNSMFHVKLAADLDFTDTDMVILAVKPQIMDQICTDIAANIPEDRRASLPILSIAAGKSIDSLQRPFNSRTPVIRAMPNTPAAIGKGMTVLCANKHVTERHKKTSETLMAAVGTTLWIEDESKMAAVTALSGSGPAYVFYLMEAMAKAGEQAGLSTEEAIILARQTVIGAGALAADEKDVPAATLRQNVTSPGGTTEAALTILMDGRFQQIMEEAVQAAKKRGQDLAG